MKRFLLAALFAAGCTFDFNGDKASFPLTGDEPSLSSLTQLNQVVTGRAQLMTGPDGTPWVIFCEYWRAGGGNNAGTCGKEHLVELGAGTGDEVIEADGFSIHGTELYEVRSTASGVTLTLHRPGDPPSADATYSFPALATTISVGADADVFTYYTSGDSPTLTLVRRDGMTQSIPVSKAPLYVRFTADGSIAVVADASMTMTAYDTQRGTSRALPLPLSGNVFVIDDTNRALIASVPAGLATMPIDIDSTGGTNIESVMPATATLVAPWLYYVDGGDLWRVPLTFDASPALVQKGAARLLSVGPAGQILYSHDPASEYSGGAGDGYIGDTQVIERGRVIQWSLDGTHVRYLEHAATLGTYGDLTSYALPSGPATTLAINAHTPNELPDHRVLTIENAVYRGSWNRLVVIDEQAGTKHWVVPEASDYVLTPDGSEVIADVVSGATGYNLYRVKVE